MRWHMEPATTVRTLDGGVFVDTNPYRTGTFDVCGYSPNPYLNIFSAYPEKTDTFFTLGVSMRDDRPAGDVRWRTTARVEQQMWVDNSQLDGGYVTAASGPMFQLTPQIAVRLAPMATFSWLNNGLDSIEMPNPWYDPVWYPDKTIYYGPGRRRSRSFLGDRRADRLRGLSQRRDAARRHQYRLPHLWRGLQRQRRPGGRRGRALHAPGRIFRGRRTYHAALVPLGRSRRAE